MGNSMSPLECLHNVALVGGSVRISIVQKMIQEFFNEKEQHSAESMVLSSLHTEIALTMNWKEGLCDYRDVEEQISVQSHSEHSELPTKLRGTANTGRGVMTFTSLMKVNRTLLCERESLTANVADLVPICTPSAKETLGM